MTTYSQLVDDMVAETRRPDLVGDVCLYLDQTIRELHFIPASGNAVLYRDNLTEIQLTASADSGFAWDVPDSATFQAMLAVRYDDILDSFGYGFYPPEKTPGRGLTGLKGFYYRAGTRYVFSGYGQMGSRISLAYYVYPRKLKYYAAGSRPAIYDSDMGWTYADAFSGTPDLNQAAQAYTTNWMLMRWDTVIREGLRAKIYKRLSDGDRAKLCYSLYSNLRQGLYTSESIDLGGYA
jgi:hypothetical protein